MFAKRLDHYRLFFAFLDKFLVPLAVFLAAFIPRAASLNTFVMPDQLTWINRSTQFFIALSHLDFAGTYLTGHPGVTTMLLSGIPLNLYNKLVAHNVIHRDIYLYLWTGSFPIVLVTSVGIVLMYYLLRDLFGNRIALISALLIAIDPYFIAYSRVIHLDALLTTFMVLSVLSLLVYLNKPAKKSSLIASGAFAGLAMLTKLPAILLIPFTALTIMIWRFSDVRGLMHRLDKKDMLAAAGILAVFVFVSFLTFVILWPSMWVNPINTVSNLLLFLGEVATTPKTGGFFTGEIIDGSYGPSYYPTVIFLKMTPVVLALSIICLLFYAVELLRSRLVRMDKNVLILILFILIFTLQMTIGSKKIDRYILPVFPFIDILAAIGLYKLVGMIRDIVPTNVKSLKKAVLPAVVVAVLAVQVLLLAQLHPYYVSYYSPLSGGPSEATEMMSFGSGEGMDLAADYLNEMPGASNMTVAVQYAGFEPYFKGKTVRMDSVNRSDYIVFYLCTVQRDWDDGVWKAYKNSSPEKVISINGINYSWIYKTKPAFNETVDDQ